MWKVEKFFGWFNLEKSLVFCHGMKSWSKKYVKQIIKCQNRLGIVGGIIGTILLIILIAFAQFVDCNGEIMKEFKFDNEEDCQYVLRG